MRENAIRKQNEKRRELEEEYKLEREV
jgi:hypothetical protein